MSSQTAMSMMSGAEFLLSALLAFLFFRKKLQRRFPAMGTYLALRVASAPVLSVLLLIQAQPWGRSYFVAYFFVYWAVYIASAVILFFVCTEVFRSALAGFSGLMRFGVVIFRWAAVVSVIVSFSTLSFSHAGHFNPLVITQIAFGLMRSVSILELCLLAFLTLSMSALALSSRDIAFGIALGFGVMSANDFVLSLFINLHSSLTEPLQFVYQSVVLAALGVWVTYAALPEPARKPVVVAATSTIYRWNEIASALGHSGTKIAVQQQPAGSFFLTDVEKVVERVLTRNLKESKTSS